MNNNPTIALLTDFGLRDGYVASMKGVISVEFPDANIIDITHEISPQNIDEAAYVLWSTYEYFPQKTIFVSVVDPGVGSKRDIICVQSKKYTFLAPDNGLLKYIFASEKILRIVSVTGKKYFNSKINPTFHGRDIFAPVAANLAKGVSIRVLGKNINPVTVPVKFNDFENRSSSIITGKIIHIDRFGNIITNIQIKNFDSLKYIKNITIGKNSIKLFRKTYSEEISNKPFAIIGSRNLLEISIKEKNAAKLMNVKVGRSVKVNTK
jgi:S-adenosyl-L-methionine hydrolase (adenosine-forming)